MIAGGPRFEEQLENMLETIKNIGNAGIPVYTMSWRYPRFYRTGHVDVGWGALGTAYDSEIEAWPNVIDWDFSLSSAWECLETWIKEAITIRVAGTFISPIPLKTALKVPESHSRIPP